ncbi:S1 family peptidase [Methylobacterium radiodurans]|uniref:Serine protease n=1 Tax=Methylobacterium radiodurans TaxID=2202828 RepID=A0A2U8VV87_9HYPH|nr:serine protease [Methylobacterium radiodurans]AWN37714.1 serine protease [Methylobacterium radiodurans]
MLARLIATTSAIVIMHLGAQSALAAPLPPTLTVDKTVGKVAGWSIGYSESLDGCLAAATYGDGTTMWFGINGKRGTTYIAFTNEKWRSIEIGEEYEIRMTTRGRAAWRGLFTGFARDDERGLFQAGLKDKFIDDLASAGSVSVLFKGRQIAQLSLVGSTEAFEAVIGCQKDVRTASAKADGAGPAKPHKRAEGSFSTGTGFFVSERGHILTNNHVVEGCSDYIVQQPGNPSIKARLVARDANNDLAVLSTDLPQKVVPPLSVRARLGEPVYVYGFPQTDVLSSTGNFTIGNVTATAGSNNDTRNIQISAPIHGGNSGGPVLDQYANVVGVIQSKQVAFASGDIPQNVNFAIKTSVALSFLDANAIEAPINVRTSDAMDGSTIAEKARDFTVQVVCR